MRKTQTDSENPAMITPDSFEMIESASRTALEKHPVWAHFESQEDRRIILDWGVAPERVDGEIERYAYCGPPPLYPVLELDPLNARAMNALGVYAEQSGDMGMAVSRYSRAIELANAYAKPQTNLGLLRLRQGELERGRNPNRIHRDRIEQFFSACATSSERS